MKTKKRRIFCSKLYFKSLSCAPINEHGVVYLFGLLHDVFDFKIESIQAGFPDCIARRQIDKDRWEELRIEFEHSSRNFLTHKHDPDGVDLIVCWEHDWPECPEHIEVIELSTMIHNLEHIAEEVKEPRQLSAYNEFCRARRLEGHSFKEISMLWEEQKKKGSNVSRKTAGEKPEKRLTAYQKFAREMRLQGKSLSEIGRAWRYQNSTR